MKHDPHNSLLVGPPEQRLVRNNGEPVFELLTHVGTIVAHDEAREELSLYGICLDYALYDRNAGAWRCCLFSAECLRMLRELRDEGQFPYVFEAFPSEAEVQWQLAQATGKTSRAPLPLKAYLTASRPN